MTIDSTDYYITSTNFYQFQTELSKTLGGLSDITNMGCLIDDYQGGPTYSKVAFNGSTPWLVFVLASILSFSNLFFIQFYCWCSKLYRLILLME